MSSKFIAALLGASVLVSAPVMAADVYGAGSTKDSGTVFTPASSDVNWTGFYIGGQAGYGNANHGLTVNESFKDYCDEKQDMSVGFDGGGSVKNTLSNLNKGKKETDDLFRPDCETYKKTDGNPPVAKPTGDVLIAGQEREIGTIDGVNSHGFFGGARLGYDRAFGRVLVGVYGAYDFSGMETTATLSGVGSFGIEKGDEWSLGARLGYIVAPRTLAYVLAAWTQTEYDVTGLNNPDVVSAFDKRSGGATFSGISVGGGIEFAMTQNIFFGLEYQHTFYGEEKLIDLYSTPDNFGVSVIDDLDEDKVMATLKVKFN